MINTTNYYGLATVEIFNISDIEKCPYAFASFKVAKNNNFKMSDYKSVFYKANFTDIFGDTYESALDSLLEDLFCMFNDEDTRMEFGFTGHSMSTSDIIRINDKFFYCDTVGWTEI